MEAYHIEASLSEERAAILRLYPPNFFPGTGHCGCGGW
jgi:hypothetical protein